MANANNVNISKAAKYLKEATDQLETDWKVYRNKPPRELLVELTKAYALVDIAESLYQLAQQGEKK